MLVYVDDDVWLNLVFVLVVLMFVLYGGVDICNYLDSLVGCEWFFFGCYEW